MTKHHKKMRGGGFWESMQNSWGSLSQTASDTWNKTKKASYDTYNSMTGKPTTSYYPTTTYGGRKTRRHRGGSHYVARTINNDLASNAASFSGKTAEPHHYVGGKHKRKSVKKNKTKKNRK